MFRNYHIVILKDMESGFKSLRMRGWFGLILFVVLLLLSGLNVYFWGFYKRVDALETELEQARQIIQKNDSQMLSLAGKLTQLEGNLNRIQQFDGKLRVMLNIDGDIATGQDQPQESQLGFAGMDAAGRRQFLTQHRDLFLKHTHSVVERLANTVQVEEVQQQTLVHFLRENKELILSTPSIWPAKGFLFSGFGWRRSSFTGGQAMHKGLDISNKVGTPVLAPAKGTVTFVGFDGAYGLCLTMNHGNNIVTHYAHLHTANVKEGQKVQRGEIIAAMGNSGRSTGPHLHYEVRISGVPVNPIRYILN